MVYPDYVVVDTQDGTMFGKDAYNHPWTIETAVQFINTRNGELKVPTYKLYWLLEVTQEEIDSVAERQAESRYGGDGSFADNH
jgi:hypothetical protein